MDRVERKNALEASILRAEESLLADQREDGHWMYDIETGATIAAEYIFLVNYLGESVDEQLEHKIARYLRRIQLPNGGWSLCTDGPIDIGTSVKAYFALKMMGDSPNSEHMIRAKRAILTAGGAEASNVFTRILLVLFGIMSWNAIPMMPVEIMLLPSWFPFHLTKIASWARSAIVPLLVVNARRPAARNPRGIRIDELFHSDPHSIGLLPRAPHHKKGWFWFFRVVDSVVRFVDSFVPAFLREYAIDLAVSFVDKRLNGEDGLGGLSPSILYSVIMYDVLGYPTDHPNRAIARRAIDKLLVINNEEAFFKVVLAPVWDTSLAVHALLETKSLPAIEAARHGLKWLSPLQILNLDGDWSLSRPNLRPGGWAIQYANPYYPDVDDTAVVVMAMHRLDCLDGSTTHAESIGRGREWIVGMQSSSGGWGAFEMDNTYYYLKNLPLADQDVLLDPPTADVTARCVSMLGQLGETLFESEPLRRACRFLLEDQRLDGSWYSRWGINYINGTWSALCALNSAGLPHEDVRIRRAARWLVSIQNEDGGWGEDASSYDLDYHGHEPAPSTASQTSWALLGLMAAGEVNHPAVERGIAWLTETQQEHGFWDEDRFTGVGFPHLLYMRYHGYPKYFPLWALARYRNLKCGGST